MINWQEMFRKRCCAQIVVLDHTLKLGYCEMKHSIGTGLHVEYPGLEFSCPTLTLRSSVLCHCDPSALIEYWP